MPKDTAPQNSPAANDLLRAAASEAPQPQPQPQPTQDATSDNRDSLVKTYGENYVQAKHKDGRETIFTRVAWNNLTPGKDGWSEVVEVPDEVKKLQNK